jgi:hypothetical protein
MHTALWKRSWLLVYKYMLDDHDAFSRSVQRLAALLRRSVSRRAAERSDMTPVTPSLAFVHAHSKRSKKVQLACTESLKTPSLARYHGVHATEPAVALLLVSAVLDYAAVGNAVCLLWRVL